jgi:hypothetical protein
MGTKTSNINEKRRPSFIVIKAKSSENKIQESPLF